MSVIEERGRKLFEAYPVGAVVTVERGFCGARDGHLAVVYEHYRIGEDHYGIGLLNEAGGYDGFSQADLTLFAVTPTGYVAPEMQTFRFRQVQQLADLHRSGQLEALFGHYRRQIGIGKP